jgi:hypothetical protein
MGECFIGGGNTAISIIAAKSVNWGFFLGSLCWIVLEILCLTQFARQQWYRITSTLSINTSHLNKAGTGFSLDGQTIYNTTRNTVYGGEKKLTSQQSFLA